jgi:hypothetical protein
MNIINICVYLLYHQYHQYYQYMYIYILSCTYYILYMVTQVLGSDGDFSSISGNLCGSFGAAQDPPPSESHCLPAWLAVQL